MENVDNAAVLQVMGSFSALVAALMTVFVIRFLSGFAQKLFIVLAIIEFLWVIPVSLIYPGGIGFWGWFFDSAAERTGTAMMMSTLLLSVGLISLSQIGSYSDKLHRIYRVLLAILFIFLSLDEYYALHETFNLWRETYAALGGVIILISVYFFLRGNTTERKHVFLFVMGFGLMGFGGVYLDAFSNEHTLSPLTYTCRSEFLNAPCPTYGILEEFFELLGASLMLSSLIAATTIRKPVTKAVPIAVGFWVVWMLSMVWLLPTVQGYLLASPVHISYLDDDLVIVLGAVSQESVKIGDTVQVSLYMRANRFLEENYSMSVILLSYPAPDVWAYSHKDMTLGEFIYPTSAWIPGLLVRNDFELVAPWDIKMPGSYRIVVRLWKDSLDNPIHFDEQSEYEILDADSLVLDKIYAFDGEPIASPPHAVNFDFAGGFSLKGYDVSPYDVKAGEAFDVRFWWSSETHVDARLTHFLHLINVNTGEVIVFDQQSFGGSLPTWDWPAGLYAVDTWTITLPDDVPAGEYRIQTGMFDTDTVIRIPILSASDENLVRDYSAVLGILTVTGD